MPPQDRKSAEFTLILLGRSRARKFVDLHKFPPIGPGEVAQ